MHTIKIAAPPLWRLLIIAAAFAVAAAARPASAAAIPSHPRTASQRLAAAFEVAQTEMQDEDQVSNDQVEKYIAVYSAMQHDHNLTVEQASSKQGLTVAQFRNLEDKIERNPVAHERVMEALNNSSKGKKPEKSAAKKP